MSDATSLAAAPSMTPPRVPAVATLPSPGEALRVWLGVGLLSFGGPTGQIARLHREVVEQRRWIGEQRFLHALNFSHLLPRPEAQQLAIYLGWLMHGVRGGLASGALASGALFVLPGAAGRLQANRALSGALAAVTAAVVGVVANLAL